MTFRNITWSSIKRIGLHTYIKLENWMEFNFLEKVERKSSSFVFSNRFMMNQSIAWYLHKRDPSINEEACVPSQDLVINHYVLLGKKMGEIQLSCGVLFGSVRCIQ